MPQFLVIAYDGTDADAPARRRDARPAHFERLPRFVDAGHLPFGGAILDDAGGMIGSVMVAEFPSRAELDAWLAEDPYVTGKVWQKIEVRPVRLAVQNGKITP